MVKALVTGRLAVKATANYKKQTCFLNKIHKQPQYACVSGLRDFNQNIFTANLFNTQANIFQFYSMSIKQLCPRSSCPVVFSHTIHIFGANASKCPLLFKGIPNSAQCITIIFINA
jgi:hypothetical protein